MLYVPHQNKRLILLFILFVCFIVVAFSTERLEGSSLPDSNGTGYPVITRSRNGLKYFANQVTKGEPLIIHANGPKEKLEHYKRELDVNIPRRSGYC